MLKSTLKGVLAALSGSVLAALAFTVPAQAGTVIELTQTACQFIESENGIERGYATTMKSDCEAINNHTAEQRLAEAQVIELAPGDYTFRVTNRDVAYALGFWLRGQGLTRLTLPSVSGGGLVTGATKDYQITLEPSEYYYSCPLDSTPDYKLVVTKS